MNNRDTRITTPKYPLKRFEFFSMREVNKIGGWVEVQVGEEPISLNHSIRNIIFGCVIATKGNIISMMVADEVQYKRLTGVANGEVLFVEPCHVLRAEYSDSEIEIQARHAAWQVVEAIVGQHQQEFDARYPEFAKEAFMLSTQIRGEEAHDYTRRWAQAHHEFANSLIAEGRV